MLCIHNHLVAAIVPNIDPLLGLVVIALGVVAYALLVTKRVGERRVWQQMIRRVTGQD